MDRYAAAAAAAASDTADAAAHGRTEKTAAARAAIARIAVTRAAAAAAEAAAVTDAASDAAVARAAAYTAYAAASAASARIAYWAASNADHDHIMGGGAARTLAHRPLWPDDIPKNFQAHWAALKGWLTNADQNWDVWIHWYENRVAGVSLDGQGDLEIAKLDYLTAQYDREAQAFRTPVAEINAELQRLTDEFWDRQNAQDPSAEVFALSDDNKIVSATRSHGLALTDTAEQREWYDEFRDGVADALAQHNENELGAAAKPLSQLAASLPDNIAEGRVPRIWRRANAVRRVLDAHDRIKDSEEVSLAKLDIGVAETLRDVVGSYNNFRVGDDGLMQVEIDAPSPQDTEETLQSFDLIDPVIQEAIDTGLVDEDATDVLRDALGDSEIDFQNDLMGRMQIEQGRKTRLNFVKILARGARKVLKETGSAPAHIVKAGPFALLFTLITGNAVAITTFGGLYIGAAALVFVQGCMDKEEES